MRARKLVLTRSDRPWDRPLHELIRVVVSKFITDRGYTSVGSDQRFLAQIGRKPEENLGRHD